MKKFLVVIDMQNDFVDGALGSPDAMAIVDNVVEKINNFDGEIFATFDTHFDNYLETNEGKNLPVKHCIKGTHGWELSEKVKSALDKKGFVAVEKPSFGSLELPKLIAQKAQGEDLSIELVGLCTDICVVSNAMILKANFNEAEITVDSSCCAGVSEKTHNDALSTMKCCQIKVI